MLSNVPTASSSAVSYTHLKQATSRKRALEKIQLDDIRPSSRKYPYIDFRPNREIGNEVLTVDGISKTIDGVKVLDNIYFIVGHDDKIAFVAVSDTHLDVYKRQHKNTGYTRYTW